LFQLASFVIVIEAQTSTTMDHEMIDYDAVQDLAFNVIATKSISELRKRFSEVVEKNKKAASKPSETVTLIKLPTSIRKRSATKIAKPPPEKMTRTELKRLLTPPAAEPIRLSKITKTVAKKDFLKNLYEEFEKAQRAQSDNDDL